MDLVADAQRRIRHPRGQRCNNNTCQVPAACLVNLGPMLDRKKRVAMTTRQVARKIHRSKSICGCASHIADKMDMFSRSLGTMHPRHMCLRFFALSCA